MIESDEYQAIRVAELVAQKLSGELTPEDEQVVEEWLQQSAQNRSAYDGLVEMHQQGGLTNSAHTVPDYDLAAALDLVKDRYRMHSTVKVRTARRYAAYAAASLLLFASILLGIYWKAIFPSATESDSTIQLAGEQPSPGTNKAFLTLADGRTVTLRESQSGIIVGDQITYGDGSQVLDQEVEAGLETPVEFLTMTTPRGGTYLVRLPDGTRVWLNADSRLTYPTRFEGAERVVELSGEAYFDVSPAKSNRSIPFIVVTETQRLEVLGTEFNVAAYAGEPAVKTTLATGRVRIQASSGLIPPIHLVPGEQAILQGEILTKQHVDVESFTAWREGWLVLQDRPFAEMMKEIARWYDIEIIYQGAQVRSEIGFGVISRSSELQDVLDMIESVGIPCKLEGRKLFIGQKQ